MPFQLVGLPFEPFASMFSLDSAQLAELNAMRIVANKKPGFPCRVSLLDAEVGDELILLSFEHQSAASPYRASGPIFVRSNARQRYAAPGAVPDYVRTRLMSIRAYDGEHLMTDAIVCEGDAVGARLTQMFESKDTAYVHLHNAKRGCFSCLARRAIAEARDTSAAPLALAGGT